jgi:hypothetical protein
MEPEPFQQILFVLVRIEQRLDDIERSLRNKKGRPFKSLPLPDNPPEPEKRSEIQRANDALICALATCEAGEQVCSVGGPEVTRYAKALKDIRQIDPGVMPEDIIHRWRNLLTLWPRNLMTVAALAKHWRRAALPDLSRRLPADATAQARAAYNLAKDRGVW